MTFFESKSGQNGEKDDLQAMVEKFLREIDRLAESVKILGTKPWLQEMLEKILKETEGISEKNKTPVGDSAGLFKEALRKGDPNTARKPTEGPEHQHTHTPKQ